MIPIIRSDALGLNEGLKTAFAQGHEWAVVMGDDVQMVKGCINAFRLALEGGLDLALSDQGMRCFALHKRAIEAVGWFDPNFRHLLHEDDDFLHRLRLGYCKIATCPGAVAIRSPQGAPDSELHLARVDQKSLRYYGIKWGGIPRCEVFTKPFAKGLLGDFPEPSPRQADRVGPLTVRLYGNFNSHGSFCRVSEGLKEGLSDLGILDGAVEVDAFDPSDLESCPGATASVGVFAGNPSFIGVMGSRGYHDMDFAILAPNSSWVPSRLIGSMRQKAMLVAPSSWGASVLTGAGVASLPPLRHGVSRTFYPDDSFAKPLTDAYSAGQFGVLHLSSTFRERKGTTELLRAWKRLVAEGRLGQSPKLICYVDAPPGTYQDAQGDPTIIMAVRLAATNDQMREFYQKFHIVCQPSRGEGFGMVPLEARACGIPVVATNCTGHWDHMGDVGQGCVVVRTGDEEPMDDGPGATAPSLSVEAIEDALLYAYEHWQELFAAARSCSTALRHEWSWANQTESWLKSVGLLTGEE